MKRSASINKIIFIVFVCLIYMPRTGSSYTLQDPKTLLFKEANEAMGKAKVIHAEIFSPTRFKTALKYYQEADEAYKNSKALESVREKLKLAAVYFLKSIETTKIFKNNFADCIAARNDALAAEAPQYRKKQWEEAESLLTQAAKTLEDGNLNGARSKARKAEQAYRKVELESIKANYLDETKALIKKAKEENVKKLAPLTLTKAQQLAQKAETLLAKNRYDTDQARELAQEAKYQAQHAIFLAKSIRALDEKKKTLEEVLLDAEKPIQEIADEFDLNPKFQNGFKQPTAEIIQNINALKNKLSSMEQDLNDKREQLATLSEELSRMKSQLGDLKSKEESLSKLMEQQRRAREKFAKIEKMFTSEEAQILRLGDKVIIRLYGLSFPVGKATIEPKYFGLLSKVLKAIKEYPECGITVEGHTDSWGSDEANQKLSTERAEAVEKYLMATAGIDSSRIIAVGYGENKPIATNETKEGRRKNRRIDIVIHPKNRLQ